MLTNGLLSCFLVGLLGSFGDYLYMIHVNRQKIKYIITHFPHGGKVMHYLYPLHDLTLIFNKMCYNSRMI